MEAPSQALAFQHKTMALVGFYFHFKPYFDGIDLITAAAPTQVLGKRKDRDSCEETLDGLMVCLQTIIVILLHDNAFVIDHKER